jgi:hypothetical protein
LVNCPVHGRVVWENMGRTALWRARSSPSPRSHPSSAARRPRRAPDLALRPSKPGRQ